MFFVAHIDKELSEKARFTRNELVCFARVFESAIVPVEAPTATPIYDMANLVLIIRSATEHFHENWHARLGLAYKASITPEHWSRVKSLARRYAYQWEDQYDTLRPVADMIKLLSERIADFIS